MTLWSIDGKRPTSDIRQDRIANGTIGGDHILPKGLQGKKMTAIIDDSDPRVQFGFVSGYGTSAGNFTNYVITDFTYGGTQSIIGGSSGNGTAGSAVRFSFNGTSIAVLGSSNTDSGVMRVYIDGTLARGRVPIYTGIRFGSTPVNPAIAATDTTIPSYANTSFPSSGYIYMNGEVIAYTSRDNNGFYGCTRGALGTAATSHNANETIYLWDNSVDMYSAGYASRQVLYYNPLLSPGPHTVIVVSDTSSTSGKARIYFDGFVTTGLIGASSISTQLATFTFSGITTDANGHLDLGGLTYQNTDIAKLALLGYTQSSTETSNGTAMARLGVRYLTDGQVYYYLHNGPPSATFNLTLSFAYIGETI